MYFLLYLDSTNGILLLYINMMWKINFAAVSCAGPKLDLSSLLL